LENDLRCGVGGVILIINKMPFELGAKKAGLSLVRAFLHSIEGVRPYWSS
jgi:hypothetical protein